MLLLKTDRFCSGTKQNNLIWLGKGLRQSRMSALIPNTYRSKQNTLIWFKTIVSKKDHFRFEQKTLGRRKTIWFGLEIVSGKTEHYYLIQNLKIKVKHLDFVQKLSQLNQNIFTWSMSAVPTARHQIFHPIPQFLVRRGSYSDQGFRSRHKSEINLQEYITLGFFFENAQKIYISLTV